MSNIDHAALLLSLDEQIELYVAKLDEKHNDLIDAYHTALQQEGDKLEDELPSYFELHESLMTNSKIAQESFVKAIDLSSSMRELEQTKEMAKNQHVLLQTKIEKFKENLKQESLEHEDFVKSNEKKQQKIEEKNKYVKESINLGLEYLGLEMRPLKDNRMQFVFHNIIGLDGKTELTLFVIIQLVDCVYRVLECEPELSHSVLKSVEDELNETNNLAGFVNHMYEILKKEAMKP